ncbi:hypothetical protein HZF08_32675 [Paenibacillus sp. CGMCC 1.16610]|uniref:Lipoprotein n=1 Tax=Paenibacillus anseongense TaxID=2682845 RepID=A0ABW9U096_9BACL|nr:MULTISPECIES: hypothetical protein [Paenibacillus]MBA2943023.1 hypothetical protein [Paenibacillus sp. CGMCC 1.16610]MVQ33519.1 hypothetical protein [Paenibacillus anseongense]
MKIKMKQIAGLCILLPALLSACGNQASPQQAAASTAQPQASAQASPDAKQQGQNRPAMSQAQRQLFSTFQTLLMMDKAEGLAITKDQAQVMLPVAQDIETKAELSDENKTKLLEKLTDAQKKFIDDAASKMANMGNGGGRGQGGNGGNPGDGTRGNFNGQKGTKPDASGAPAPSSSPNAAAGSDGANAGKQPRGNGGNGGNRPAGGNGGQMMKDPGKQLVELLQERVK